MSSATTHPPEVREKLRKAGFSEASDLTEEQLARAKEANADWSARKLGKFIMEGENGSAPAKERSEAAKLAERATKIAEKRGKKLGSPITTGQAQRILDELDEFAGVLTESSPKAKLTAYAEGGKISDLPEETRTLLREFGKEHGDRRLWPRKVVALVLALPS